MLNFFTAFLGFISYMFIFMSPSFSQECFLKGKKVQNYYRSLMEAGYYISYGEKCVTPDDFDENGFIRRSKIQDIHYKTEDLSRSFSCFKKAFSLRKRSIALYKMGFTYQKTRNFSKAIELYNQAINLGGKGKDYALNSLGWFYLHGLGVEKDIQKAKELFEQSSNNNHATASVNLAEMYRDGNGVEKDIDKAIALLQKSIIGDSSFSLYREGYEKLAEIYITKKYNRYNPGLAKTNYKKAFDIYEKYVAKRNDSNAMFNLGWYYREGADNFKLPSSQQSDRKALEWYKKASHYCSPYAFAHLGDFYLKGRGGLKKDVDTAKKYYKLAANRGNPWAMNALAWDIYRVEKKYDQAIKYARMAANKGLSNGMNTLGVFIKRGYGEFKELPKAKREKKAVFWFEKSAKDHNTWAIHNLAWYHLKGLGGLKKDRVEAKKLYQIAADKGNSSAMYRLVSIMIEQGSNDYKAMLGLLEKSAKKGYSRAAYDLGGIYLGIMSGREDWTDIDVEKGIRYIRQSSEKGLRSATLTLARFYDKRKNFNLALEYFKKSTKNNLKDKNTEYYAESHYYIGKYYLYGIGGLSKSEINAKKHFKISAEYGDLNGQVEYANLLIFSPKRKDHKVAFNILLGQKNNLPMANYHLSEMYETNVYVKQNSQKAAKYMIDAFKMKNWDIIELEYVLLSIKKFRENWSNDFIYFLQKELKKMGHYKYIADGKYGKNTEKAIFLLLKDIGVIRINKK